MHAPSGPPTYLNAARRELELNALVDGEGVDVLVIGGGVTGAGVALDAQSRGLTTALLERRDLATGTSRWSSKLAHGGLRYLAQGHPSVAWESARERHHLATYIAPHLIRALPQLSPPSPLIETGVRLGDGMRALAGTSRKRLPCARRISAEEARRWAPALAPGHGPALLHWDGQLEDDARLVVAIARTAAAHGAKILTYAEVEKITATGVSARDALSGERFDVRARHVINATGVWAGRLVEGIRLKPSRGSHILIDAGRLGDPRASVNIPIPGHFGRFVFAIPRPDGLVMIGLTDDPHTGDELPDAPRPTDEDIAFLLENAATAFATPLTEADIVGSFSGLRPLLASADEDDQTSDISRGHQVITDPETNAVTIVGGKLTTYRRMAQDAVDTITARPGAGAGPCVTERLPLVGGGELSAGAPPRLVRRFGSEAAELAPGDTDPIAPGLPALHVELRAAVEREGALTAGDILDVRTRLGLVPAWRAQAAAAAEEAVYAISSSRPTISSA
jgi:glycerol-3-phosphate dehydrogenase